jgi:integrase
MSYTASIRHHPNSQFWQAQFWVYDASQGRWRRVMKSTKCSEAKTAQKVADEFQSAAFRVAPDRSTVRLTREDVLEVVNDILKIAGHRPVLETRNWDEYSQEWLALQKSRIAPRSLESYAGHVRLLTRWLDAEKTRPLNLMDGETLQEWYFDMIDEGRKPATANNAVKTLQSIFDRARAEGFCPRNPAELVLRQYGPADIREPFNADDLAKILAHLRKTKQTDWLTVCLLGICTGQRFQDCADAKPEDFTPATKKEPRVWHNTQGKTGKLVHIPIVEPLESHLRTLQLRPGVPLAPSLAGKPTGGNGGLSEQFSAILDDAGVVRERREKVADSKGRGFTNKTFHSFRHTTNTLLDEADVPYEVRKDITGHSSARQNERYTHRSASKLAAVLKRAISDAVT